MNNYNLKKMHEKEVQREKERIKQEQEAIEMERHEE